MILFSEQLFRCHPLPYSVIARRLICSRHALNTPVMGQIDHHGRLSIADKCPISINHRTALSYTFDSIQTKYEDSKQQTKQSHHTIYYIYAVKIQSFIDKSQQSTSIFHHQTAVQPIRCEPVTKHHRPRMDDGALPNCRRYSRILS